MNENIRRIKEYAQKCNFTIDGDLHPMPALKLYLEQYYQDDNGNNYVVNDTACHIMTSDGLIVHPCSE